MSSIGLLLSIFIIGILQDWQVYGEGCTCKDFVGDTGHGNCRTKLKPQDRFMCYVEQPSSCTDLVDSTSNPGEKFSFDACTRIELCACKFLIGETGYGNCKKELDDKRMCYVEQPSSCPDLTNSNSNPGEQFSFVACVQDTSAPKTIPTPSPTISLTSSPTISPTSSPTISPTCKATRMWTQKTAIKNCSPDIPNFAFGVMACESSYQTMLEVSLANKLFTKCSSRCVYAYDRVVDGDVGGFVYSKTRKCYKYKTKGGCFKGKRLKRFTAKAKKLCKIVL